MPNHIHSSSSFFDALTDGKQEIVKYLRSIVTRYPDVIGLSIVTTLGIGGAAAIYYHQKKKQQQKELQQASKTKVQFAQDDPNANSLNLTTKPSCLLVLHQCPRGRRTPSIAPYPLKLETFLRVHDIMYEVELNGSSEPRTHSPWITLDLEDISDSQNCIQHIRNKYGIASEEEMDEHEKGVALAYNMMLENHLYWGIALWRWVFDEARSLSKIQVLPKKTQEVIPDVCRTVEQAAWFHGLGKKTQKDVIQEVNEDLKALSEFLGKKQFFMGGDQATELDCTAFAMLSQMLWNMDGCPFEKTVKETYKNLADFCWRMRARYWPDWSECLNNNLPIEDKDG